MNDITFQGIRIPYCKVNDVHNVVKRLDGQGFRALGYKKLYISNEMSSKIDCMRRFRETHKFSPCEYGAVIFPWSGESYLVSTPENEQLMFSAVKKLVNEAYINILV